MSNWDMITERRKIVSARGHLTTLTDEEWSEFLDNVAERGAQNALKKIGLQDEAAYEDIRAIRGALKNWRVGVSAAWGQLGKFIMFIVILFLAMTYLKPSSALLQAVERSSP